MVSHSGPRAMYTVLTSLSLSLSVSSQLSAWTEDTEETSAPAPEVLCQPSPDYLGLQTVLQFPAVHCSEWSPGQTVLDDEDRVNKLSSDVTE